MPLKKRRVVNGQELVFRKRDEDSDGEGDQSGEEDNIGPVPPSQEDTSSARPVETAVPVVEAQRIIIHEDD